MPIVKSTGVTRTERLLADLCERTFHHLWSYPNPFKDDKKELCDLIVVFGDDVFLFFDRESRKFDGGNKEILVTWMRWKKEAIDKQIKTARGAEKYIRSDHQIFLDAKNAVPFPIAINKNTKIHKFVVAHGAKEACEEFSDQNVFGSLGISYGDRNNSLPFPFMVNLDKNDIVHVLDSHNLEILFGTFDTLYDFSSYISEKERAIREYDFLSYCGEEDLIAHYILNYNKHENQYQIGTNDKKFDSISIGEGEWKDFSEMAAFARREEANKISYLWDDLIQRTCKNALDGTIRGNADLLRGKSALHEMAKEPRVSRRALMEHIKKAIHNFPETDDPLVRNLSFMPSFYEGVGYVFLQLKCDSKGDYETEYRPKRQAMLEIACGSARIHFSNLKKVVGIAIDAPRYAEENSEDFILMECDEWSEELAEHYRKANEGFNFFKTPQLKKTELRITDFPVDQKQPHHKIGRNEPCYCGSGKKYKNCCLGNP